MRLFDRFQNFTDADIVRAIENRESEIKHRESEIKVLKKIQKQRAGLDRAGVRKSDAQVGAAR